MRFLSDLKNKNLKGKVCLVRADLNVEGVADSLRLERSLPTLRFLLKNGARIVLLSHRGRPTLDSRFSLQFLTPFLESELNKKVLFFSEIPRRSALSPRQSAKIFLVENLRFWKGEEKNDLGFAKKLARLGDFYVNDAFAVCHRRNASIVQLPKLLPAYAGLLLAEEIRNLSAVIKKPKKPLVLVFGGAKIADKLPAIKKLLPKASAVLLGSSAIDFKDRVLMSPKVYRPTDWLSHGGAILDIGPLTVENYKKIISRAKTVIWNGPLGRFEEKRFAQGSIDIAKAIAASRAFSVIGGGETTQLAVGLKLEKKFGFLSTGGGAMLEFLAGKKLPGIEALK